MQEKRELRQKKKLALRGLQMAVAAAALSGIVFQAVQLAQAHGLAILPGAAAPAPEKHAMNIEKCYGVVKAHMNDCASKTHGHTCASQSPRDADADEYVEVPTGLCLKIAGGSLQPKTTVIAKAGI